MKLNMFRYQIFFFSCNLVIYILNKSDKRMIFLNIKTTMWVNQNSQKTRTTCCVNHQTLHDIKYIFNAQTTLAWMCFKSSFRCCGINHFFTLISQEHFLFLLVLGVAIANNFWPINEKQSQKYNRTFNIVIFLFIYMSDVPLVHIKVLTYFTSDVSNI